MINMVIANLLTGCPKVTHEATGWAWLGSPKSLPIGPAPCRPRAERKVFSSRHGTPLIDNWLVVLTILKILVNGKDDNP